MSDVPESEVGAAAAPSDPVDDPVLDTEAEVVGEIDEADLDEVDVEALLEDELVGESDDATSVEDLVTLLESTTAERDEYLDLARRTQAEFENHRKRAAKQLDDEVVRKVAELVEQLLPVLDACDGAVSHGATEVEPIFAALLQTLEKRGLERIDPVGSEFDPTWHEAVMHEPAHDDEDTTVVTDVLRAGYAWQGRVVRPAMVKVKG